MRRGVVSSLWFAVVAGSPLAAQAHQHVPSTPPGAAAPAPGQAAFGAIAEVVARLDADPATDWSRVNVEALRQHLLDMDRVTMGSRIAMRDVEAGFEADVTGEGEVAAAIRRMTHAHFATLGDAQPFRADVTDVPGGVRLRVVMRDAADRRGALRLRGLGVIGLLTLDAHHGPHHEMLARGMAAH
jgi:hypothetical protein